MLRQRNRQTGSFLIAALVLVLLTCTTAGAIIAYSRNVHKQTERTIAFERATAAAEAGTYQLLHYVQHSGKIPANCVSERAVVDTCIADSNGTAIPNSGLTFVDSGKNESLIQFKQNGSSKVVSRITSLRIVPPDTAITHFAPGPNGAHMRFVATAEAFGTGGDRVERTAVMDVALLPDSSIIVPAGLITGGNAASNGHFNLHWGSAWSKQNINLKFNVKTAKNSNNWTTSGDNTVNRATEGERWVTYESATGFICDKDGVPIMNDAAILAPGDYNPTGAYAEGTLRQKVDAHTPQDPLTKRIDGVLSHFNTVGDPNKGYDYFKQLAIARDTYFHINANGTISNQNGSQTFGSMEAAMEYYRSLSNVTVAFFDTKDGQPPRADKSNWLNASFSGNIEACSKGILYFCGNLTITGAPAPSIPIRNPDEVTNQTAASYSTGIYHNGVVFTWGDFVNNGNSSIYGSAVVNGSYDGGGNPNIFYNQKLKTDGIKGGEGGVQVRQRQI